MPDQKQREQALNPSTSYIVQAPAGSGKTELLVQRFLTLLASVNQPEEIIALTFTNKAAAEMRLRILDALQSAADSVAVKNPHQEKTRQLAIAALLNNQKCSWNLLNNPNRLQILTIDSLCVSLTRKMPLLSHFGATPDIVKDAKDYYLKAARKLLATLETEQPWSKDLQRLLLHLDNNHVQAEKLFVTMLAHREQWLPHILSAKNQNELRQILEQGLQNIILENLSKVYQLFPSSLRREILELYCYAVNNLKNNEKNSLPINNYDLQEFHAPTLDNFSHWQDIANLLLTKEFSWRKQINVKLGFPPENKIMKKRMENLLKQLESLAILQQALKNILESPAAKYHEEQWELVNTLIQLLPVLAAQLTVIFRQHAKVDFIEISSSAIRALGEPGLPSDLALHLDYKIQHLLVDEFQDTSLTQFRLLELLTSDWQTNDSRTLFLVGDPMQSIYRFRQAEVGLFLRAKNFGIGNIKLNSLNLSVNFRSQANIIAWLNKTFDKLFPQEEDIATGAVTYNPSVAFPSSSIPTGINILPFINASAMQQAQSITAAIATIKQNNPKETIAILVRSRTQLEKIIPALKATNIKFRGVEIEKLSEHPVVQDLFALTRALLHLADKVAWLAILRAPWCGLTLADLYLIANDNKKSTVWEALIQYQQIVELSADAKIRLARILPLLAFALQNRQRQNLRAWIEHNWRALGGPATCNNENELECAQTYFNLLEQPKVDDDTEDLIWLQEKLQKIYSPPDQYSDDSLQIMTIHKAKGLEFDHVILPSLESKTTVDENRLLMWLERPRSQEGSDLILAPIKSSFEIKDAIYNYLRLQEKQKSEYELIRLLYVAMTRTKKTLCLLGNIKHDIHGNDLLKPPANSFLALLWPAVEEKFLEILPTTKNSPAENLPLDLPQSIRRFKQSWISPLIVNENLVTLSHNLSESTLFTAFSDATTRAIGVIVHRTLQKISQENLESWDDTKIQLSKKIWKKELLKLGVGLVTIDGAIGIIEKAIRQTLHDQRGRWLLMQHEHANSELSLTTVQNDKIIHLVIDRTFIYQNERWIVDYKTSHPASNEDLPMFLTAQQQLYGAQLNLYAQAINNLEKLPIRLGLYFPLISGWIELTNSL